uniref:Phage major capsid protein n=1 Tax=Bosea sp. NBC_00436 TaxID=2969620 RepID=A0A9E7ZNI2_9HYPH
MPAEHAVRTEPGHLVQRGADARIKAVETKSADASKLADRLDKLEAKANRLPASNDNQTDAALETKAFTDFLRTGQIDQKSLTVANDAPNYVLAPEDRASEFIRNLVQFSPVRAIADVKSAGSHIDIVTTNLDRTQGTISIVSPRPSR